MGSLLAFLGVVLILVSAFGPGGVLALIAGVGLLWAGIIV